MCLNRDYLDKHYLKISLLSRTKESESLETSQTMLFRDSIVHQRSFSLKNTIPLPSICGAVAVSYQKWLVVQSSTNRMESVLKTDSSSPDHRVSHYRHARKWEARVLNLKKTLSVKMISLREFSRSLVTKTRKIPALSATNQPITTSVVFKAMPKKSNLTKNSHSRLQQCLRF